MRLATLRTPTGTIAVRVTEDGVASNSVEYQTWERCSATLTTRG